LRIWRHDNQPIRTGWDTLQSIKNEMLGEDVLAIEVFPPEDCKIDEVNCRHLWLIPEGILPTGMTGWDSLGD
jgi:hypothetical protein